MVKMDLTEPNNECRNRGVSLVCVDHLMRFVKEQAEVGKDHPELLPAITVLELPQ